MGKLGVHIFGGLAVLLGTIGCFEIVEPTPPFPDELKDDTESASTDDSEIIEGCGCDNSDVSGHVYRFTAMIAERPLGTRSNLTSMWKSELKNQLLNILFHFTDAEKSSDKSEAFSSLSLTAGSGWRYPVTGGYYYEDLETIETYCFLKDDMNVDVSLEPTGDDACTFTNDEKKTLFFHIGSMEEPLECAPELGPADSTPLHNLKVTFGFDKNCDQIVDGYLEGCLPGSAVDRICMCGNKTGTCGRANANEDEPFPEVDDDGNYPENALRDYCFNRCGSGPLEELPNNWVSFRNLMDLAGDKDCKTEDGEEGYTLAAHFEAEDVTSLYSDKPSDCTEDGK